MHDLFNRLEEAGIKKIFRERFQERWDPETSSYLVQFLSQLEIEISPDQLRDFLWVEKPGNDLEGKDSGDVSAVMAIEVPGEIEGTDGECAEIMAEELSKSQTIELEEIVLEERIEMQIPTSPEIVSVEPPPVAAYPSKKISGRKPKAMEKENENMDAIEVDSGEFEKEVPTGESAEMVAEELSNSQTIELEKTVGTDEDFEEFEVPEEAEFVSPDDDYPNKEQISAIEENFIDYKTETPVELENLEVVEVAGVAEAVEVAEAVAEPRTSMEIPVEELSPSEAIEFEEVDLSDIEEAANSPIQEPAHPISIQKAEVISKVEALEIEEMEAIDALDLKEASDDLKEIEAIEMEEFAGMDEVASAVPDPVSPMQDASFSSPVQEADLVIPESASPIPDAFFPSSESASSREKMAIAPPVTQAIPLMGKIEPGPGEKMAIAPPVTQAIPLMGKIESGTGSGEVITPIEETAPLADQGAFSGEELERVPEGFEEVVPEGFEEVVPEGFEEVFEQERTSLDEVEAIYDAEMEELEPDSKGKGLETVESGPSPFQETEFERGVQETHVEKESAPIERPSLDMADVEKEYLTILEQGERLSQESRIYQALEVWKQALVLPIEKQSLEKRCEELQKRVDQAFELYSEAKRTAEEGDPQRAIEKLNTAIEIVCDIPGAMEYRKEVAFQAQQQIQKKKDEMVSQGERFYQEKHFPEAIDVWLEILSIKVDHEVTRKIAAAERHLQQAKQLFENAQLLSDSGKNKDACLLLEQCLEIYPYHESGQQLLNQVKSEMLGARERIEQIFETGNRHLRAGEFEQAKVAWEQARFMHENEEELAQWDQKVEGLLLEAMIEESRKHESERNYEKALEILERGKAFFPQSMEISDSFASIEKRRVEAQRHYNQAIHQVEREDFDKALEFLDACLAIWPDHQEASFMKQSLHKKKENQGIYDSIIQEGNALFFSQEFEKAMNTWQRGLGLTENDEELLEKIEKARVLAEKFESQKNEMESLWADAQKNYVSESYEQVLPLLEKIKATPWMLPIPQNILQQIERMELSAKKMAVVKKEKEALAHISRVAFEKLALAERCLKFYQIGKMEQILSDPVFSEKISEEAKLKWAELRGKIGKGRQMLLVFATAAALLLVILISLPFALGPKQKEDIPLDPGNGNRTAYSEQEKQVMALLERSQKMKNERDLDGVSDLLSQLERIAPDQKEIIGLRKWMEEEKAALLANEVLSRHKKTLDSLKPYAKSLEQEVASLAGHIKTYEAFGILPKTYPSVPEEAKISLARANQNLATIRVEIGKREQSIRSRTNEELPEIPGLTDEALLVKLRDFSDQSEKVLFEIKRIKEQEVLCQETVRALKQKNGELLSKIGAIAQKIEQCGKYPTSQGYQGIPDSTTRFFQSLKGYYKGVEKMLGDISKVLEEKRHDEYLRSVDYARSKDKFSVLDDKIAELISSLEKLLASNHALAQKKIEESKAAASKREKKGEEILGDWYQKLSHQITRYENLSYKAVRYMKTKGARMVFFTLRTQLMGVKRYPVEVGNLEEKLQKLEEGGMNLIETLDQKIEKIIIPSQKRQIRNLKKYIYDRKVNLDIQEPLANLSSAVDDLTREVEEKNVEEKTMRSILSAIRAIEREFTETRQDLYAEILNLQTNK